MRQFTINGKQYSFPESWEEATLDQLLKINAGPSTVLEIISIFTGEPQEELSKSKDFKAFEEIEQVLSYLSTPIQFKFSEKPSKFVFKGEEVTLPSDIGELSIAQYQDLKFVCFEFYKEEGEEIDVIRRLQMYVKAVAVYLQPIADKADYDFKRADEIEKEIYNCSAVEVADWGNFFIRKFIELRDGILKDVQTLTIQQQKQKQGSRSWLSRLVSNLPFTIFHKETSKNRPIS